MHPFAPENDAMMHAYHFNIDRCIYEPATEEIISIFVGFSENILVFNPVFFSKSQFRQRKRKSI